MREVALIGYGYWGPNVARQLHANKRVKLSYICDKKPSQLDRARKVYVEQVRYVEDYRILLEDPAITGIALAVETSEHFRLAKEVLDAGKHLYVEKPFTSTVAEARELKRIAEERKLAIHVDHIMIYHAVVRKIKEILDSGELGDIIYIEAQRANLGQIKSDVSSMWDLAVHDLSIIDYLSDQREATFISAVGEKLFGNPKEVLTFLTLRYEGFLAHIKSSWFSPIKERRLIVAGTKKMAVFDDIKTSERLMIYDKGFERDIGKLDYLDYAIKSRSGDAWSPWVPEKDALYTSLDRWVDCMEGIAETESGCDSAIRVLSILESADKQLAESAGR